MRHPILAIALILGGRRVYRLLATGKLTIDTGVGRRVVGLGPLVWQIAAARETVFDVIAGPYLGLRAPSKTSCRSGSAARTWSWQLTSRP